MYRVQVTSIRASGNSGGVIFAGDLLEDAGRLKAGEKVTVIADYTIIESGFKLLKGEVWKVEGSLKLVDVSHGDITRREPTVCAKCLVIDRPTGNAIIDFLASNPKFAGIGRTKARRLWERFGESLPDVIASGRTSELEEILAPESARILVGVFEQYDVMQSLMSMELKGIPAGIVRGLVNVYGVEAPERIVENPYRLSAFYSSWRDVDAIAQKAFGIEPSDLRRLASAVGEVAVRAFSSGNTAIPERVARQRVADLVGDEYVNAALLAAHDDSSVVWDGANFYSPGAWVMEQSCARRIASLVRGEEPSSQMPLSASSIATVCIDNVIEQFENAAGFSLAPEQKQAVAISSMSNFSLILGGAGVGKTTVLQCVFAALEAIDPMITIYQLALAGRAAQRMTEATGRPAQTIAGFIYHEDSVPANSVVVVDEASMVDLISMYRLLEYLPDGVRVILVGDPVQLPPVGPGLVFHALVGSPSIPQTTLKVVQRQSESSGIPAVASAVRNQKFPEFAPYAGRGTGVSFVQCSESELSARTFEIYADLGGKGEDFDTLIIGATKAGPGGVSEMNRMMHDHFREGDSPVVFTDEVHGRLRWNTLAGETLKLNDLVMYTSNDYELGLRNGSLGRIVGCNSDAAIGEACDVEFDGEVITLSPQNLEHLTLAYAITVHKSQGSQARRVIMPIRTSRLLDQSLLYTGITRGVEQVVLVGDIDAALSAVQRPAAITNRKVGIHAAIASAFASDATEGAAA